ncbi:MAG TPA: EFR1 family ferrodoxin [Syntrophomonas sp.]|nr:EFR1 family ferrodoxin [Syntrophomonas sp.]
MIKRKIQCNGHCIENRNFQMLIEKRVCLMILYFSATGNSRYIAERIARETNDETVSLNLLMKENKKDDLISETKPFVFVCPTYAWRLPRVVDDYIRKTVFKGNCKVYFVMTCGGETAGAIRHVKKLCQYKGWDLQGFAEVVMPDNYIVMFPAIDKATAKNIIEGAKPLINRISVDIHNGNHFSILAQKGIIGWLESGLVNGMFYKLFVHAKGFHVNETKCVCCGKCAELCPLNNIAITSGKPVWGYHCTHCMACLHRCPTEAIEYKKNTQNKTRYFFDNQ